MSEQLRLPFPKVDRGVSFLRGGAQRFAAQRGRTYDPSGLDEVQAAPAFQHAIAREYEQTPDTPDNRIGESYKALVAETEEQFGYLTRPRTAGGLGVKVEYEPELEGTSIYPTHKELIADVGQNRRLRVNKTGSSPADQAVGHPFLTPDANDKFRAVHDAFGHAGIGRSFSRHGEEAAYQSHAQMYSEAARPALLAETRAQNSTLNYGSTPGQFPEQKPIRMPGWAGGLGAARVVPDAPAPARLQAKQFRLPGIG